MRKRNTSVALIVRRGALRRFHKLTQKAADLPVGVVWDRRQHDRRAESRDVPGERRAADRRRNPPFTWRVGDFVVVRSLRTTSSRSRS
jgi:hypothetical protein